MRSEVLESHAKAARNERALPRLLSTCWRQISRGVALEEEQRLGGRKQACYVRGRSVSRPEAPSWHRSSRLLANGHFDGSRSATPGTRSVEPMRQPKPVSCCLQWKEVFWLRHQWEPRLVRQSAGI